MSLVRRNTWWFLAIFAIALGEFGVDLVTPVGTTDWVFYFIPLLLSAFVGGRFFPYALAGLLSLLLMAGFYLSPPGIYVDYPLTARLLGLAVLWMMALLISRRKEVEESLRRTKQALKTICDCNQALVRATTEPALLNDICGLIVSQGGYELAWVGFLENDAQQSVRIAAHAGDDDGYLAQLNLTWADTERGHGPAGTALRTGQASVFNDFLNQPASAPWRAAAARSGFASVIALPLLAEGKTFGVLTIYAGAVNAFQPDEIELLQELAGDLAYGLQALRTRLEHQAAEERLRRLSRAVEQSPVSIVITDPAGGIEYVNPKFIEVTGYTFDEVRGQNPRILRAGQEPAEFYRQLWQTISAGHEWRGEFLNRKKNGETYWESASISPITGASGRITGYVAVKEDITRAKLAEEKIREQAEMINLAHDAISLRDLDDRILFWNRSAERIYGWTAEEATGQIAHELFGVNEINFSEARRQLLAMDFWVGEFTVQTKNRRAAVIEASWTLMRDARGQPKAILAFSLDITHRRRLEQQVARAQRIESLGTLASGVAHDLNNILTPIMVSIGLLKEQTRDPLFEQLINSLESGTQRGARLVKQILTFGRDVTGERVPLKLREVAREIEQFVRETFPRSIQFAVVAPDQLWTINGDPTQIHQVLLNLAINARDAMPNGGRLTLTLENIVIDGVYAGLNPEFRPGPHVRIEVADTGMGMSKELIERIFDPFFSTKPSTQGTGLGLSTALGIIKSHGGCIHVYSQPGKGSTFKIHFPAIVADEAAAQTNAGQNRLPRGNQELVLLVDDEAAICKVVQKMLERSGYRVKTAVNGAEAVSFYTAHAHEIALVITDMNMPVMDGAASIVALQAINPQIKIIASSGLTASADPSKAATAGTRHFMPKPYTAERLLRTVREVLDGDPARG